MTALSSVRDVQRDLVGSCADCGDAMRVTRITTEGETRRITFECADDDCGNLGHVHHQIETDTRSRQTGVENLRVREEISRIANELREAHLPELEAAGIVEWNPQTDTVERGPNFEAATAVIDDGALSDLERAQEH